MSRATISTGSIAFEKKEALRDEDPGYVLVLGDFSGNASRSAQATPKLRKIDRDNFDEVFAALNVTLQIPLASEPLRFSELDELHPDFLYEHIELFDRLRSLEKRLRNRDTFAAAAEELGATKPAAAAPTGALSLDDLLSSAKPQSSALDVKQLIADIVAPFIVPAPDPQQGPLLEAVGDATGELMRKLMHQSAFRELEAAWRGLYLLLRRVDGDREPEFILVDCVPAQLPTLLAAGSELERLLQKAGRADTAPRLVLASLTVDADTATIDRAHQLAEFAARHDTIALAAGAPILAGCGDLRADPEQWQANLPKDGAQAWETLRASPAAEYLALIAPRFLMRLPYGKRTSTTERFAFEETAGVGKDSYQLWGNGAWLAALARLNGTWRVDSLPLQQVDDDDAPSCTEVILHDRAAARLKKAGLLPLRSERGEDAVLIPEWVSIAKSDE